MIEIFDCPQGSEAWFQCRMGIPTASQFSTVMASGKGGGPSLTRTKYMRELVAERITGEVAESYSNHHFDRGKVMEVEARDIYAFNHDDAPLQQVGFIRDGKKGCSPDALVGAKGMVEFKSALPHILIDVLQKNEAPTEHAAQCQGGLWVAQREWIDLAIFWPKLPMFEKRIYRDEVYIAAMSKAVSLFNEELDELEIKIRKYL